MLQVASSSTSVLFPSSNAKIGFRTGSEGTHTSRTMMFDELRVTLDAAPNDATKSTYRHVIVDENRLGKSTTATRRLTFQRLSELYGLDPAVPLFRTLRNLMGLEPAEEGKRLIALLAAIARDPLLAATVRAIVPLEVDRELTRSRMTSSLRDAVGERLNASVLDKVARNAASSWTQSGHLEGRTFKKRRRVRATAVATAFALYLAFHAGFRGDEIFDSPWMSILDLDPGAARERALEAKQSGILDLRIAGDVVSIDFSRMER